MSHFRIPMTQQRFKEHLARFSQSTDRRISPAAVEDIWRFCEGLTEDEFREVCYRATVDYTLIPKNIPGVLYQGVQAIRKQGRGADGIPAVSHCSACGGRGLVTVHWREHVLEEQGPQWVERDCVAVCDCVEETFDNGLLRYSKVLDELAKTHDPQHIEIFGGEHEMSRMASEYYTDEDGDEAARLIEETGNRAAVLCRAIRRRYPEEQAKRILREVGKRYLWRHEGEFPKRAEPDASFERPRLTVAEQIAAIRESKK